MRLANKGQIRDDVGPQMTGVLHRGVPPRGCLVLCEHRKSLNQSEPLLMGDKSRFWWRGHGSEPQGVGRASMGGVSGVW